MYIVILLKETLAVNFVFFFSSSKLMYMRNKQYKYVLGSRIYLLASKQILQQKLLNDYNGFF